MILLALLRCPFLGATLKLDSDITAVAVSNRPNVKDFGNCEVPKIGTSERVPEVRASKPESSSPLRRPPPKVAKLTNNFHFFVFFVFSSWVAPVVLLRRAKRNPLQKADWDLRVPKAAEQHLFPPSTLFWPRWNLLRNPPRVRSSPQRCARQNPKVRPPSEGLHQKLQS